MDGAYLKKLVDVLRVNNQKLVKENKALQGRIEELVQHIKIMEEAHARKYAMFDDFEDEATPRNIDIAVKCTRDPFMHVDASSSFPSSKKCSGFN